MTEVQFFRALFELEAKGLVQIDDEADTVRLTQAGIASHTINKDLKDCSLQDVVLKSVAGEPDDTDN